MTCCSGRCSSAMGAVAIMLLRPLRAGSALDMGPGYMPMALSLMAIALGLVIAARGLIIEGPAPERWALLPLAVILAAIGVFMVVPQIGLVAAVAAVTLIAALAEGRIRARRSRWRRSWRCLRPSCS
jgi:hypothetical protein